MNFKVFLLENPMTIQLIITILKIITKNIADVLFLNKIEAPADDNKFLLKQDFNNCTIFPYFMYHNLYNNSSYYWIFGVFPIYAIMTNSENLLKKYNLSNS